jgi:hypothetical protein
VIPFGPTVHVLKVTLRDVEPQVWRRLVVRSEAPLPKLNQALERVMGWEGCHLHMFDVGGILFGEPDEDADYVINERAATVKHVLPRVGASLRWDYDFGDGWGGRGDRLTRPRQALPGVPRRCSGMSTGGLRWHPGLRAPPRCAGRPEGSRARRAGRMGARRVRSGGVRPRRSEPKAARTMSPLIQYMRRIWNEPDTRRRLFQRAGTRLS